MTDFIGSRLLHSFLPTIVKENIEIATFFALLSYVLFLVNWLVSTDWIEKVCRCWDCALSTEDSFLYLLVISRLLLISYAFSLYIIVAFIFRCNMRNRR